MISILICDDDKLFVDKLRQTLESAMNRNKTPAKIHAFNSAEEIGSEVLAACDIAFLDIDFQGKSYNGLDIARKLRRNQSDAVIVFVTNYIEYAPEGYEVQAFRYILKNELPQKLESSVEQILAHIRKAKSNIKIQTEGELVDIRVQDLLFIESMKHTLIFHVAQKGRGEQREYSCYSSLSKMEEELAKRGFLRIHKSFLVNMAHIRKLNCNEALLDDGTILRVGSKTYAECKRQYLLWRGQN